MQLITCSTLRSGMYCHSSCFQATALYEPPCHPWVCMPWFTCCSTRRRLLLLDYDGTLIPHRNISAAPPDAVLEVLAGLTADTANEVWIISGRSQQELGSWFEALVSLNEGQTGVTWQPLQEIYLDLLCRLLCIVCSTVACALTIYCTG